MLLVFNVPGDTLCIRGVLRHAVGLMPFAIDLARLHRFFPRQVCEPGLPPFDPALRVPGLGEGQEAVAG